MGKIYRWRMVFAAAAAACVCVLPAVAGPYSGASGDSENPYDAPIPGWTGPLGDGFADSYYYPAPGNYVNPAFVGWATSVVDYYCPGGVDAAAGWDDSSYALGEPTGDEFEIVSLGDMSSDQLDIYIQNPLAAGIATPGYITLGFAENIYDGEGVDFAVFENGFGSGDAEFFAELAYVEVSSDGVNFARFDGISLTAQPEDPEDQRYLAISATNIYNLAGKHANAHGHCWGTPFDLSQLAGHPLVTGGLVNLNAISYVRIVDIPGNGDMLDSAGNSIYDAWPTYGSGGFDLDAVGVLYAGDAPLKAGDANGDGHVNLDDFIILKQNYGTSGASWSQGDFNGDASVDLDDFIILKQNYGS